MHDRFGSCMSCMPCTPQHAFVTFCVRVCALQDPLFGGQGADNVRHGSFSNPTGPPPPYESVITDAASHSMPPTAGLLDHSAAGAGAAGTAAAANGNSSGQQGGSLAHAGGGGGGGSSGSHFEIVVADPVKQGEGVSAYVSYKVKDTSACVCVCWVRRSSPACLP